MLLALETAETTFWSIALGIGLVVILVVILLLTMLMSLVRDIDVGADSLWTVTKRMAQNTTGTYQLAGTGSILRALREECLRHDVFLADKQRELSRR